MPGGSVYQIYLSNGTIITPCRASSSILLLDSSYVVSCLHSVLFPLLNYISIIIIIQITIIIIIIIIIIIVIIIIIIVIIIISWFVRWLISYFCTC